MLIEVVIFSAASIALLAWLAPAFDHKEISAVLLTLQCAILALFYGLRIVVPVTPEGRITDTYNYSQYFISLARPEALISGEMAWKGDYIFFLIPLLVRQAGGTVQEYLFVNAMIWIGLLGLAIQRLASIGYYRSVWAPLVIFLLMCSSTMVANYGNLLRQAAAISMFLLAFPLIERGRRSGWLIILLGLFVHKSILFVGLAFLIVRRMRHLKVWWYWLLIIASVPFVVVNPLSLIEYANIAYVSEKFLLYAGSETASFKAKLALALAFGVGATWLFRRDMSSQYDFMLKLYLLMLAAAVVASQYEILAKRLLYYPSILIPIMLVGAGRLVRPRKIYYGILSVGGMAYLTITYLYSDTFKLIDFRW